MANVLEFDTSILSSYEGVLLEAKKDWYQSQIDKAVRMLLAKLPSLQEWISSGELDKDLVADKVGDAVLRVIRNPEGLSNESGGGYSYGLANRVASGDLWFGDNDLADLTPVKFKDSTGLGQFRLRPTPGWAPW